MRRALTIVAVLSLSVLPAQGVSLETNEIFLLTPIDSLPTRNQIASVAPEAPRTSSVSLAGMAEARPSVRVRISVWLTAGRVSSRPSAADAAAKAGTPGVMV